MSKASIEAADKLAEKVQGFLFFYTEGTAQELGEAATAYLKLRKASEVKPANGTEQQTASESAVGSGDLFTSCNLRLDMILRLIQGDPHQWSERPCNTCQCVTSLADRPFGCILYAQQRKAANR